MAVKLIKEGNNVSRNLPSNMDKFLQDFAQMYGEIDYNDIIEFGDRYKDLPRGTQVSLTSHIRDIKSACKETGLDIYETAQEYDDVKKSCDAIISIVKGDNKNESMTKKTEGSHKNSMTENPTFKKMSSICEKYGYKLWEAYGERYKEGGRVYYHIHPVPNREERYLPEIFYFDRNNEFSVQTTSYGSLNIEEYEKFIDCVTRAHNCVLELSEIDISDLYIDEDFDE